MDIVKNNNVLEIEGVIKTMNDASKLNESLEEFQEGSTIILRIKNILRGFF